jgi:Na+/H+ antiporter NhaD/arsenite permease-like protein
MTALYLPLLIFVVAYALFIFNDKSKPWVACLSGALLLGLYGIGVLQSPEAEGAVIPFFLGRVIQWNVLGLMTGMMVISKIFEDSRIPAVMAENIVDRSKNAQGALFWVTCLTGFFSIFLCNVSCVLLIAPVALSLTRKLKMSPVRPLICLAIASNLQGVATLIGDPPSMLMAGHMKLGFNDFFVYQGKLGIFWAVQAGAVASSAVVYFVLRSYKHKEELIERERARSWVPAWIIGVLVLILAASSSIDKAFVWLAGTAAMVFALAAGLWFVRAKWGSAKELLHAIDWSTLFFLVGMFIMVQALSDAGWLQRVAGWIASLANGNMLLAFCAVVGVSVAVSAVVDNVPFLIAMIPVADNVARGFSPDCGTEKIPLMMFGLLAGACLGGNITPIGASANIVAMGILRKEGYPVTFPQFMRVGLPFTVVAVLAGCGLIWLIWA